MNQRHAKRINIGGWQRASLKLLERHVAKRSGDGRTASERAVIRQNLFAHRAEINQKDALILRDDDISRLHVAMNDWRRKAVQIR